MKRKVRKPESEPGLESLVGEVSRETVYRSLHDSGSEGVLLLDREGVVRAWNSGAEEIFGFKPEEVLGKADLYRFFPDCKNELETVFAKDLPAGRNLEDLRTPARGKNGRDIRVSLNLTPLPGKDGVFELAAALIRDVTQEHKLQQEIRDTKEMLERMIQHSPGTIIVCDTEGVITLFAGRGEQMFGYKQEDVLGQHVSKFYGGGMATARRMQKILEEQGSFNGLESEFKHRNGSIVPILLSIAHMRDEKGKITGSIGVYEDLSRIKTLESELVRRDIRRTQQIQLARNFQMSLTPPRIVRNQLHILTELRPAYELSGDFFTAFDLSGETLCFIVGDVSNKGISAAFKTITMHSVFETIARRQRNPSRVMEEVNKYILNHKKPEDWFVTAIFGKINTRSRRMSLCNAGHEYPIYYSAERGEVEELEKGNIICGMFEGVNFNTYHLSLETGDKMLFFTDGLCDLRNEEGKRFRRSRIVETFRACAHLSGHEIRAQFISILEGHGDLDAPDDDILFSIFEIL